MDEKSLKTGVRIKACGVWDSVRSVLGNMLRDTLIRTEIPKNIEEIYHALSLDEKTKGFQPTLWQSEAIKQCWFSGYHSDIGGGNPDVGLANITLVWMIAQFVNHTDLCFNEVRLLDFLSPAYVDMKRGVELSHTLTTGTLSSLDPITQQFFPRCSHTN